MNSGINPFENLPVELIFYILTLTEDVQYYGRLNSVSKKIKDKLAGHENNANTKQYWAALYHRDFQKSVKTNPDISVKDLYKTAIHEYKAHCGLLAKHRKLFYWIRSGDLASIKQQKYNLGNNWFNKENDFADHYDRKNVNAIILASICQKYDILDYFYQQMCDHIYGHQNTDSFGRTKLHWAAMCGKDSEISLLKSAGINQFSSTGITPLYYAVTCGIVDTVKSLILHEANINVATANKIRPLATAAYYGHLEVMKVLLQAQADFDLADPETSPIYIAATQGHEHIIDYFLQRGVDINFIFSDGDTLISIAACNGQVNLVKALLQKKASCNVSNKKGFTPLSLASVNGHLEVVKILLQAHDDLNAKSLLDHALLSAALKCHFKIMQILLESGAKLNPSIWLPWRAYSFLKFWEIKELNKNASLVDQIIAILEISDEDISRQVTFFFTKNSMIKKLNMFKREDSVIRPEDLKLILEKYRPFIAEEKYNFIINTILNTERDMEITNSKGCSR